MASNRFNLPFILPSQAQKHITHNKALDMLDGLLVNAVVSATVVVAPSSPVDGESYIVPLGGSFGSVPDGGLAIYTSGQWVAVSPPFGFRVLVLDEGRYLVNAGSAGWVSGQVVGDLGGSFGLRAIDVALDLSGSETITAANMIPTRSIVFGVTSKVQTAITGPSSFQVGFSGELSKFGGSLGVAAGSSNIGVVGPSAVYSPTSVVVTAGDGSTPFTGGQVHLSASIIEFSEGGL